MRLALVSLIALAAGANAFAQTAAPPGPAPAAAPSPATDQSASPPTAQTPVPEAPPASAAAAAETPPAPPPPPTPPTDPTAIEVLNVLQQVCIPAADGGNFVQLAKTAGFRKSGDGSWTMRQKEYVLTLLPPGSNPNQCHLDVSHPADLESPGRPIIVALNDWAAVEHGWSLYRNDKSVQEGMQFTTRSWQHDADGKEQSLVFTTQRKPDGTPLKGNADQSILIYGVTPLSS